MTSWRSSRSISATRSRSISSRASRSASTAPAGISTPSSRWVSARAIHRSRHVSAFRRGEKTAAISGEAYRSMSGCG